MIRFNKASYLRRVYDYANNIGSQRNSERGFSGFIADVLESIDILTCDREKRLSVLQIGIGGGGDMMDLVNNMNDVQIYGVDHFSEDLLEYYKSTGSNEYLVENFDEIAADIVHQRILINETFDRGTCKGKLFYGLDAYTQEAADTIYNHNQADIDYIYDDGAPQGADTLLSMWKDKISNNGMLISTTVFGNGTSIVWEKFTTIPNWLQDNADNIAKEGWIVFDMEEYGVLDNPPGTEYIMNYMAVYAKDYNKFEELLTKYQHNIIAGENNWRK